MFKYASATLYDPRIAQSGDHRRRTAHRVEFEYTPREGYLYVRSRMISSRCNDNFDEFTPEEIKGDGKTLGYVTFVGKPVFVNHHNEDHRRARGIILDAKLHEDRNADGSPDTWVEGLMEVDAIRFPKLAKAILAGEIDRTSMGVDVERSQCSKCANVATTPLEYCRHIPAMKGTRIRMVTASGQPTQHLVRERCFGLRFFENSLLVEEPADPTAYFLGSPVQGPKLASHTASRREPPKENSTMQIKVGVRRCAVCFSGDTVAFDDMNECLTCTAISHITAEPLSFEAGKAVPGGQHAFFDANPVHHANVVDHWNQATDDEKDQGKRWYSDAHLITKAMATLHKGPEHPRGNVHLAAGMVGNYSPQTPWDANKHNAARVLHEGRARGGKGEGIMATGKQKEKAQRMLDGESHEDVMSPKAYKVHAFTHLVEHGGDADPSKPRVCVDRHALSVATGKRMSNDDYGAFPKASKQHYDHVASAYHEASKHISEAEGEHVPPHAVQATTWLVRQRLNQQAEHDSAGQSGAGGAEANQDRLNKGRTKSRSSTTDKWEKFRDQHLPGAPDGASTGYSDAQERLKGQNEEEEPEEGGAPKPYRRRPAKPKAASRQGSRDFY